MATWKRISCTLNELNLDKTLVCGQSFRWKQNAKGEWISVLRKIVLTLKQDPESGDLLYKIHNSNQQSTSTELEQSLGDEVYKNKVKRPSKTRKRPHPIQTKPEILKPLNCDQLSLDFYENILKDYFQLDISVYKLYQEWCKSDEHFSHVADKFPGIRILRQDPIENLFAFICSSNNNISRISSMVEKLCIHYGEHLMEVDGDNFYSFPTINALAVEGVESKLRELGFGYRAKYIAHTAKELAKRSSGYLDGLRLLTYEDAHSELIKLHGIGAKVADCICLMSLDKCGAIPVDTHVWQIAARDYLPHLKGKKSVTASMYKEIGDFFRGKFGPYAGWAHSVLFCSDLKKFQK